MGDERQYLKHGKALCGKVFAKFVETFNWLVDFGTNLKGDADVNEKQGSIRVDRSDPRHPVIRLVGNKKEGSGTGGGSHDEDECVTSLNSLTGSVEIVAGKGIRIEIDGQRIKIIADSDAKEQEEENDPCEHPEGGDVTSGDLGGVPADDGTSHGDPCTSEDCDS